TCPPDDIGSTVELSFGNEKLITKITKPHTSPLIGLEKNRTELQESLVKDFIPMDAGTMHLTKGTGTLTLKAIKIRGSQVMDFRLLMLKRL
ncbi:MAG TPA: hypothetical protein VKA10_06250, partial [Prolixibacteraceae bacterium]|nr:hypothetical protein [Prolixibacteraceae bacterium]